MAVIFVSGRKLLLSSHALDNMAERGILEDWLVEVLTYPVAIVVDEARNSTNYYGTIEGRTRLLKVAISRHDDRVVVTTYFDSGATRRYRRGEL